MSFLLPGHGCKGGSMDRGSTLPGFQKDKILWSRKIQAPSERVSWGPSAPTARQLVVWKPVKWLWWVAGVVVTRVCPAAAMLQSGQYPSSVLTGRGAAPEPHLYGDPDKLHRLGAKWCLILGKLPRVNFHVLADQTQSYLKRLLFIKHFSQSFIRNCTSLWENWKW